MSRISVLVCALCTVALPSISAAQMPTVPGSSFTTYCITPSGGVWSPGQPCVQRVVAPPTGVPAWLEPTPAPSVVVPVVPMPAPVYVPPPSVNLYTPPPPVTLDPSIILGGRPATFQSPLDTMNQVLLLQQLLAARHERPQYRAPAPPPPPPPPAASGDGWMGAFIKSPKP